MKTRSSPNAFFASVIAARIPSGNSSAEATTRIPLPPPPAEAFTITGYPISAAAANASSVSETAPLVPGTHDTPDPSAKALDSILSPITLMACTSGPINARPAFCTASTNSAFSDKNPYPGWIASAPVSSATSMSLSIRK